MKNSFFYLIFLAFNLVLLSGTALGQTPVLGQMFDFVKPDTLEFSNGASFHLAAVQDGADIVVLNGEPGAVVNYEKAGESKFQLLRMRKGSNGKLTTVASSEVITIKHTGKHGVDICNFFKSDYGFVVVSPECIIVFSNELKRLEDTWSNGRFLLSAVALKGTSQIAYMAVQLSTLNVHINIWDYKTDEHVLSSSARISSYPDAVDFSAHSNQLYALPDGNLLAVLHDNAYIGATDFGLVDINNLRAGKSGQELLKWYKRYNVRVSSLKVKEDGWIDILIRLKNAEYEGDEYLRTISANPQVETAAEFASSINAIRTPSLDGTLNQIALSHRLKDGRILTIGNGKLKYGFQNEVAFMLYDSNMKPIRQYHLPTKFVEPNPAFIQVSTLARNFTELRLTDDGYSFFSSRNATKELDIENNATDFFAAYSGRFATWMVLDGPTNDKVIVLTRNAVIQVDLTKFTPYKQPKYTKGQAIAYTETETNTPVATNTPNSGTKPAVKPVQSTTITIVNDLTTDQNTKYGFVKIVFDGGNRVTTTISRGHDLEIDCTKVKGIYKGNDKNTAAGDLVFKTEGKCGQTIKLSEFW